MSGIPVNSRKRRWNTNSKQNAGFVKSMDTQAIGRLLVEMGGGRKKVTDSVDPGVGMIFHKKLGTKLRRGTRS